MPFEKGKATKGAGRKGYEIEQAQLEKMRAILNKYLVKVERILENKEKKTDARAVQLLSKDIRKILDKLHATKQETDVSIKELPQPILDVHKNNSNK